MTLKFGKFKGQELSSTPKWYQEWLLKQEWFKIENNELNPPSLKSLKGWDGHGRIGQGAYDAQFEFEKRMQEKYEDRGLYEEGGLYYGI